MGMFKKEGEKKNANPKHCNHLVGVLLVAIAEFKSLKWLAKHQLSMRKCTTESIFNLKAAGFPCACGRGSLRMKLLH